MIVSLHTSLCVHIKDSFLAVLQSMQNQTWKYVVNGDILIDMSLSKATVGELKEE